MQTTSFFFFFLSL